MGVWGPTAESAVGPQTPITTEGGTRKNPNERHAVADVVMMMPHWFSGQSGRVFPRLHTIPKNSRP